jgi:uncharacterized protein with PIN domain
MGSLKRKIARNAFKKSKKAEKQMADKLMMFDMLDDECAACTTPFDKKSKEHAETWSVVVREQEKVVRLYCPDCWNKAREIIEQVESEDGSIDERSE